MTNSQSLPAELQDEFFRLQTVFCATLNSADIEKFETLKSDAAWSSELSSVWLGSEFFFDWSCRQPTWFFKLFSEQQDGKSLADCQPSLGGLLADLNEQLDGVDSEDTLIRTLRLFRQQQMLRIIWRDITRRATTLETTAALTALADACIQVSVNFLYPKLCLEWGTPYGSLSNTPQSLLVLAMGKLGAYELNLSSDIDLIFAYDESGETQGVPRSISNRDFFTKLGQKLIQVLDKKTAEGFVFRVDMRLRPYGDSGALVLNYDAMEQYYQQQGRDWERYAMIKARLVCGDPQQAAPLLDMLRRFTFRRYLDFSSIDSLRELKRQIEREVVKKGMADNVKLGKGGIREIEFVVQLFQLIHGGRDKDLQPAPVIPMLAVLAEKQLLEQSDVDILQQAYFFLRNTEHLLQAWRDEQTQMLPTDAARQIRVAWLMGFASYADFYTALQRHREQVQRIFSGVIAPPAEERDTQTNPFQHLWDAAGDSEVGQEEWQAAGFADDKLRQLVCQWHSDKALLGLPTAARDRLDKFMPLLLKALSACSESAIVFERLLPLLKAVLRRSSYLVLLLENPQALKQLMVLVEASSWIAEQLSAWPVLLDELIDARNLYRDVAPSREELANLLRQHMLRIPEDDLEAQMEALRHFKRAHSLRAAACEVTGRLPLMKVSDYLTFMAEVILDFVLRLSWNALVKKHGAPVLEDGSPCELDFIVVGYGKLGGLELGHGSDLDLVFIHATGSGETLADKSTGQVPIENGMFFTRLGQKIIHILNTRTMNGILYEVDMRLRPSGESGLLVASLNSFSRYQEKDAWTWEHQALVRARVVAGCSQLAQRFETVRAQVLGRERDREKLRSEVVDMRQRMRKQLDKSSATHFDLKHGVGGIVDLEFIVQFCVLGWGHAHANLLTWTDNIRILEQMAASRLMPTEQADALMEAYRRLRARGHRRTLLGEPTLIGVGELLPERQTVEAAWRSLLGQ
jgi:glutamate-ammonia-ligase adenylyltransferase